MDVIHSLPDLSTAALLLASCVQIALLTLLVGRSRRRRQQRYVQLPQLQPQPDDDELHQQPASFSDAQQRAAWKGEMLRRFDAGGR